MSGGAGEGECRPVEMSQLRGFSWFSYPAKVDDLHGHRAVGNLVARDLSLAGAWIAGAWGATIR